ncbi:MAG: hypothetical protein CME59_07030 [Halioglobus sp.]|nr:hypothetical protein [Halioglobus sp.]
MFFRLPLTFQQYTFRHFLGVGSLTHYCIEKTVTTESFPLFDSSCYLIGSESENAANADSFTWPKQPVRYFFAYRRKCLGGGNGSSTSHCGTDWPAR